MAKAEIPRKKHPRALDLRRSYEVINWHQGMVGYDPLSTIQALGEITMGSLLGGGSKPAGPSKAQIEAEKRQKEELAKLEAEKAGREAALKRSRRGRASLISGEETGLKGSLGG